MSRCDIKISGMAVYHVSHLDCTFCSLLVELSMNYLYRFVFICRNNFLGILVQ